METTLDIVLRAVGAEATTSKIKGVSVGVRDMAGTMKKFGAEILATAAPALLAIGSVAGAIATLGMLTSESLQLAGEIQDLSEQLNISAESLQVLRFAAQGMGIDAEKVTKLISEMHKTIAEAATTGGKARSAFEEMGVSLESLNGRTTTEQLETIARGLAGVTDKQKQYTLAAQIFGEKQGPKMLALLRQIGVQGFGKLKDDIAATYGIMSDETVSKLDEMGDAWAMLKTKIITAFAGLVPILQPIIKMLGFFADLTASVFNKIVQLGSQVRWLFNAAVYGAAAANKVEADEAAEAEARKRRAASAEGLQNSITPTPANSEQLKRVISFQARAEADLADIQRKRANAQLERSVAEQDSLLSLAEKKERLNEIDAGEIKLIAEQARLLNYKADLIEREVKLSSMGYTTTGYDKSKDLRGRSVEGMTPEQLAQLNEAQQKKTQAGSLRGESNQLTGEMTQISGRKFDRSVFGQIRNEIAAIRNAFSDLGAQLANALGNVVGSAVNSLSDSLYNLITKTQSLGAAVKSFFIGVGQAALRALTDMVAQWIINHTVMAAISWAFKSSEASGHVAMEGVKSAATAAGAATRTGIVVGETAAVTVAKGTEVAVHGASEAAKTGFTLAGGLARIGMVIKEAIASVWNAGLGAMSAMASIPYVGPILAIAALGAVVAAGFAIVGKIGKGFADGGYVSGPGSGTSDSIPARLSNGEYVMPAAAVRRIGRGALDSMRAGAYPLAANSGAAGAGQAAAGGQSGAIVLVDSRREADRFRRGSPMETQICETVRRNKWRINQ